MVSISLNELEYTKNCTNKFKILCVRIAQKTGSDKFKYSMEELAMLRNGDVTVFKYFMDHYVSAIVGKQKFKKVSELKVISSFVTVSDEAFALLTVKNNQEVWPAKFRNKGKNIEEMEKVPDPQYTNRRRYGKVRDGWTKEGQREFLKYYNKVMDDRKTLNGIDMEKELLELYQSESTRKHLTMHNREEDDGEIVFIPNDWEDNDEDNKERNQEQGSTAVVGV